MRFVYGSRERIFVNTALGCNANCVYCYLPDMKDDKEINYISAEEAIDLVEKSPDFVKGEDGTIISIGCYSECLNAKNINKTKLLLEHFLPMGNYIQLATKQAVTSEIIDVICRNRKFEKQVSIYISMPTISGIEKLEQGTAKYGDRINNIEKCKNNEISVVLYVKPFLEVWTFDDRDKYVDIIKKYDIPIVVGGLLSVKSSLCKADVGEELLYEQKTSPKYQDFLFGFEKICNVYIHSIEVIDYFKKMRRI